MIADTVAAVFRDPQYAPSHPRSPLQVLLAWMALQTGRALSALAAHHGVALVIRIATLLALTLLVLRLVLGLLPSSVPFSFARHAEPPRREDPWQEARRLAAAGQFTGAAHALYRALLLAASARGTVRLDEAKTTGDYLREMQRRDIPEHLRVFREFTRAYERAVYAAGGCGPTEYARLVALAVPDRKPG